MSLTSDASPSRLPLHHDRPTMEKRELECQSLDEWQPFHRKKKGKSHAASTRNNLRRNRHASCIKCKAVEQKENEA